MPYSQIRISPIQWQLRLQWSQSKEKSSKLIPLDLQSRLAILWWTNRDNLRRGVPIGTIARARLQCSYPVVSAKFLAKTMDPSRPETDYAPVTTPALGPSMGEDLPDRLLCPVRALRYYLKLKHKGLDPNNRFRRLLCAFKLGHIGDYLQTGWIRQLIKQAYSAVQDEDIPHLTHTNFQARELRAFASSLAFHQNYSLKQVMEAASWRNNSTFVSFYLRDLSQMGDVTTAGPFVAGQKVISC